MTTCFRSASNIFHPQLRYVKNRWRFCHLVNGFHIKFQSNSSFLEKFLEKSDEFINERHALQPQSTSTKLNPIFGYNKIVDTLEQLNNGKNDDTIFSPSHAQLMDILSFHQSTHDRHLHSFDPVYFALKPVLEITDEIHETRDITHVEDDIICKRNYRVDMILANHPVFSELFGSEFHYSPLTEFEKRMIDLASESSVTMNNNDQTAFNSRPTNDQLDYIYKKMSESLPKFFTHPHDYSMYHPDIIFDNNIRGITTKGLSPYVHQLALVRIVGHLKFAHVRLEVLKITQHSEDSTVRVRWRIRGISGITMFRNILKIRFWHWKKLMNEESDWYDGFSTFYVGGDGKIYRHVCDKMMPDDDKIVKITNKGLAAKLAVLLGVVQRPALDDLSTILMSLLKLEDIDPKPTVGK